MRTSRGHMGMPGRAALTLMVGLAMLGASAASPNVAPVTERWVIGFENATLPSDLGELVQELHVVDGVALHALGVVAVTVPTGTIDLLEQRDDVLVVRPERRIEMDLAQSVPFIGAGAEALGVPTVVDVDGTGVERGPTDGTGVTVAVVDTGVWMDHPDLQDRVIAALDFELAYAGEMILSTEQLDDFAAQTGRLGGTSDDVGHGTHVAGIVAGTGAAASGKHNQNAGVAPGASIVDLRISPQGHTGDNNFGWERNALAAYDWLVRNHASTDYGPNGIRVVNNSWGTGDSTLGGGPLDYDPFDGMLTQLHDEGVVVVFSAGNSGPSDNVTEDLLPTGHPTVITVAAGCHPGARSSGCFQADPDASIASFSSRGPAVDITAPGVDILSAVNVSSGKVIGSISGDYSGSGGQADHANNRLWYANFSGTSMSGPHIAGVAALLLQVSPTLTPYDVRFIMTATARDLLERRRDIEAGWGMIDVTAAIEAAARHAAGIDVAAQFPKHDDAPTLS